MIILADSFFVERETQDLDWVLGVLLSVLFIVSIQRFLFTSNYFALRKLSRFLEINDNQFLFAIINQFLFALLISTLIAPYLTHEFDFIFHTTLVKVVIVSFFLVILFWIKYLFNILGNFAFKLNQDTALMVKTSSFYRSYAIGALWIAVVLFYFTSIPHLLVLILSAISLILLRGLQLRFNIKLQSEESSGSWYYNILYLCALEILPILVLGKLITI